MMKKKHVQTLPDGDGTFDADERLDFFVELAGLGIGFVEFGTEENMPDNQCH